MVHVVVEETEKFGMKDDEDALIVSPVASGTVVDYTAVAVVAAVVVPAVADLAMAVAADAVVDFVTAD